MPHWLAIFRLSSLDHCKRPMHRWTREECFAAAPKPSTVRRVLLRALTPEMVPGPSYFQPMT